MLPATTVMAKVLDDAYTEGTQWKTFHILGTVDCMKTDR